MQQMKPFFHTRAFMLCQTGGCVHDHNSQNSDHMAQFKSCLSGFKIKSSTSQNE